VHYPPRPILDLARFLTIAASKVLWRITYLGRENVPAGPGGLLIVANHQTYFDPFWICAPFRRKYRFMAWDKAFGWFLIGPIIKFLGSFPVDTETGRSANVLRESLAALRDGATLVVFPEGVREFSDGRMLEFKTGAVRIAAEADVRILPVTVRGANRIWPQDLKIPRLGKVEIVYHPVFDLRKRAAGESQKAYFEAETARLASVIASELH
jgi:1-acyl-sn-glycerol-3-phosphate acyltransferase